MKTISIMQPTYLPWLGYFDLMDQSDIFVLLDSVQFDKRSWQQRNRIKCLDGELFLTVPVLSKGRFDQKICEAKIDNTVNFSKKHLRAMESNYARADYYSRYIKTVGDILGKGHAYLCDLTIDLITWLKGELKISAELVRSSKLEAGGKKADLLVDICKKLGADRYLSPAGARVYIEERDIFSSNGLELIYHNFSHPSYKQLHGEFIPHLSVIDLLFNEGDNSLSIIRSGRKQDES